MYTSEQVRDEDRNKIEVWTYLSCGIKVIFLIFMENLEKLSQTAVKKNKIKICNYPKKVLHKIQRKIFIVINQIKIMEHFKTFKCETH